MKHIAASIAIFGTLLLATPVAALSLMPGYEYQDYYSYYEPTGYGHTGYGYNDTYYVDPMYSYQQPYYQQPKFYQQMYFQPTYFQPSYVQPTYYQPAYQQPRYQEPSYQQPYQNSYGAGYGMYGSSGQNFYGSYGNSAPNPYAVGMPTGDQDAFGRNLCVWQDYGRSRCDFNPRQPVYDVYTGTWY